jgi:cytoskeletal protein RodZ
MSLTLGEKLRQAREERGITISEVAEQTRISPLYLESIEKDEYKILPGGIFNKGFIKSYAKYVGVDENEALQDYAKVLASTESEPLEEYRKYRPEVLTDDGGSSSMIPTIVFAGIILALMTGGILFVVNYIQNQQSEPAANLNAPAANANTGGSNLATSPAPAPAAATDRIDVELKAVSEPVWISYTVDGTNREQTLAADESLKAQANDSFKVSYSRSRMANLQIFLNGQKIQAPDPGAKGKVEFEINKENIAQYLKTDETSTNRPAPAQPRETAAQQGLRHEQPAANTTATTSSPRPSESRRPTAQPAASPKPAAPKPIGTPIVIGRPPTPGASPQ